MQDDDTARDGAPAEPRPARPAAGDAPEVPWRGVVERLGWGGQGVGRLDDRRIVLLRAPLALFPGEEVSAALQLKARHGEGRVLDWLALDPRRVEPACPYAMHCGGCDLWGAGDLAGELKRQMLEDLFHRSLPLAPEWDWLGAPAQALRQRIQLHWDGARLGYHERNSNDIVPVAACLQAEAHVCRAVPLLRAALESGALPREPMRWELLTGTPPGTVMAVQAPAGMPLANPVWAVWEPAAEAGDILHQGRGNPPLVEHQLAPGKLRHGAGGFFQVCPAWAVEAFARIFQNWRLSGDVLYDVYGGVGFHSALLAGSFTRLVIVEEDTLACSCAQKNLSGRKHTVCNTSAERWLGDAAARLAINAQDVVLLDPPRAGLPAKVCAALCGVQAAALVLCGCDGANFCRDVKRLAPGWRLERLAAIDLFPNTVQVECVGLLRRV